MSRRDRIRSFWTRFMQVRARLAAADEAAMGAVLAVLQEIDGRLTYHVGHHDTGFDLILSAEGHAELLPALERVAARAPAAVGCGVVRALDGDLVLGRRNLERFPPDATGDALYRIARGGVDDLTVARDVDFSLVFRARRGRDRFVAARRAAKERVELLEPGKAPGHPHEVLLRRCVVPSYPTITAIEEELEALAGVHGGRLDGWGCCELPVRRPKRAPR